MPTVRVVTWNSNGEVGLRAADLTVVVNAINASFPAGPAVSLVATQEANQPIGGNLYTLLQGGAAPFLTFHTPPQHCTEALAGQTLTMVKGYNVGWDTAVLTPMTALSLIDFATDPGVLTYLHALGLNAFARQQVLRQTRFPAFMTFMIGGHTVKLISWHLSLRLAAPEFLPPSWAMGYKPSLALLQQSNWWTTHITGLAAGDVAILVGDLNAYDYELGQAGILPGWRGMSTNLSHILAYRPHGNPLRVSQSTTDRPMNWTPGQHNILSARITW